MPLNRRLIKDTYVLGQADIDFLFGIPSYLTQTVAGTGGAFSTVDAANARCGSLKATTGAGTSSAKLSLGNVNTTIAKAVCIDLTDVYSTNSNPWLQFGLIGASDYIIFDAGNGANGPRLLSQKAVSTARTIVPLVNKQQFTGVDLGLEIDCVGQTSQMHVDHSWVNITNTAHFPTLSMPLVPLFLQGDAIAGANAELYVKQLKIEVYR